MPFGVRKRLAESLVMHNFDCALLAIAFCDINNKQSSMMQKAMNAVIRFIFRLKIYEHVTPYFKQLGWLKMNEKMKLATASLLFKLLKSGCRYTDDPFAFRPLHFII